MDSLTTGPGGAPDQKFRSRFWSKVQIAGEHDCWLWTAAVSRSGYGSFRMGGKYGRILMPHRVAYELSCGPVGEKDHILHSCDRPLCCNPSHLSIGNHLQNMKEMAERGRCRVPRPGNGVTKISPDDQDAIRRMYDDGASKSEIARKFSVTASRIRQILNEVSR